MQKGGNKVVGFAELENADLFVDVIYEGGHAGNAGDDPLHCLLHCGNQGGFRKVMTRDKKKVAYVVLYTSMVELEWPDYLDNETGLFRYYGDNRKPGRQITDTKAGGNLLLEDVFSRLNGHGDIRDIPPFLIFKKVGKGRDAQFLGLAAPGNPTISSDHDLVAFWRTMVDKKTLQNKRFQNYEAYFTVLDTGDEPIPRQWLEALINDYEKSLKYAPPVWKRFIAKGRKGIKALQAPRIHQIPTKMQQLNCDEEGRRCINAIRKHYVGQGFAQGFELCATTIMQMMDNHFQHFDLTRPWRDGGRDAIGYYSISQGGFTNYPLKIDCALEAKCYDWKNSVGVKQMSRLISRIRYRQFGIMFTTSYVDMQAYSEVLEDGHPILIVTATDIARELKEKHIGDGDIEDWLLELDQWDERQGNLNMQNEDFSAEIVAEQKADYLKKDFHQQ